MLLCSRGSSAWCSVTTSKGGIGWEMEGSLKREGTCVHVWLIHAAVWQKPMQHCKTIILQLKINKKKTSKQKRMQLADSGPWLGGHHEPQQLPETGRITNRRDKKETPFPSMWGLLAQFPHCNLESTAIFHSISIWKGLALVLPGSVCTQQTCPETEGQDHSLLPVLQNKR